MRYTACDFGIFRKYGGYGLDFAIYTLVSRVGFAPVKKDDVLIILNGSEVVFKRRGNILGWVVFLDDEEGGRGKVRLI